MIRILKSYKEIDLFKKRVNKVFGLALKRVKPIIRDVKLFGDKALISYTRKYDNVSLTKNTLKISKKDIEEAYQKVDKKVIQTLKDASMVIKKFCENQLPRSLETEILGIKVSQIIKPIAKIGCYIPGGNYPLPSTALMTIIPAKVAGVKDIIVCTPPKSHDMILVAADIAGANTIFRVGGAQAIAALAYGTETIPKVHKIVGPGNIYVTAAKKLVYGEVGLDFLAGPTELLIIADYGNERFISAEMVAQAEHDPLATTILITTNELLARKVKIEINKQLKSLNSIIANTSIRKRSAIIIVNSIKEAIEFVNEFAPEHLIIITKDDIINKIENAGAIFIGEYSSVAIGDYLIGNHVLPTAGYAKVRAGLNVLDFIKLITAQEADKKL